MLRRQNYLNLRGGGVVPQRVGGPPEEQGGRHQAVGGAQRIQNPISAQYKNRGQTGEKKVLFPRYTFYILKVIVLGTQ